MFLYDRNIEIAYKDKNNMSITKCFVKYIITFEGNSYDIDFNRIKMGISLKVESDSHSKIYTPFFIIWS